TDLFSAIDILIEDFESGPSRRFLLEARANLEQGKPFWYSFSQHPEYFSPVVVNLIKAGENSGNLETTLNQVSVDLERERNLTSKVKSALIYPLLLVVASFAMVIFLVTFAIPKLGDMFLNMGRDIPVYTRVVLTVGMFLNRNIFWVVPLMVGIPLGLFFYFSKTKKGKEMFNDLLERIPVARDLISKLALERFASVLSSLIKAGMPIIQALETTAKAVSHPKYEAALLRISKEHLVKGLSLGEAFKREKVFPAVVSNLLVIGEKAGQIEDILRTLAGFYETEIDVNLKTLVSLIEPVMLIIMGVVVGGIALSLIVPVYQLVSQF
ncbi:MAG: type II secretion system F family protein, partial [Candidatus Pacebacteria bacterium]|nr:type II secretion system F family protein [Candidatus Paceibacterota bacterium]